MWKKISKNEVGRDFVVGDIHGFLDELNQKLLSVNFDPEKDRLFSVGDIVDRGPRSKDALTLLAKPWFYAIRGNHEQMAIDRANPAKEVNDYLYRMNGGGWNLELSDEERAKYAEAFDQLPYVMEIETKHGIIGLVHAQCYPNDWEEFRKNFSDHQNDAIWGRNRYFGLLQGEQQHISNIHLVIVGHCPIQEYRQTGNILFIDTFLKARIFTFVEINSSTITIR